MAGITEDVNPEYMAKISKKTRDVPTAMIFDGGALELMKMHFSRGTSAGAQIVILNDYILTGARCSEVSPEAAELGVVCLCPGSDGGEKFSYSSRCPIAKHAAAATAAWG